MQGDLTSAAVSAHAGVTCDLAYRTAPWIHLNRATSSRRTDVGKDAASQPLLPPNDAPTPGKVERLMAHASACHDPNNVMPRQADYRCSNDVRFTTAGQRKAVAHRDPPFGRFIGPHRAPRSGGVRRPARCAGSSALLTCAVAVAGDDDFVRRDCTAIPTTTMTDPIANARTKISSADMSPP